MKHKFLTILLLLKIDISFSTIPINEDYNLPFKNLTLKNTRFIIQKEFSVASADDEKHIVATFGIGPCVAVGIYDSLNKKAGLAHCDGITSHKTMGMALYQTYIGGRDYSHTKIYLFSQDTENITKFYQQLKYLDVPDDAFTIISAPIYSDVGIDAKSGTFFTYTFDRYIHMNEDLRKRSNDISFNLLNEDLYFIRD